MKHLLSTRRRRIAAAATTLALVAAIGFAAWLVDGTGQGSAKIGQLQAPIVTAGAVNGNTACFPGQTCDGSYSIDNTANNSALVVSAVSTPSLASDAGTSTAPGCAYTNISVNDQGGLSVPVPAGQTTTIKVPNAYRLASGAPTECQGATLTRTARLTFSTP